jgi:hypothetical protein
MNYIFRGVIWIIIKILNFAYNDKWFGQTIRFIYDDGKVRIV